MSEHSVSDSENIQGRIGSFIYDHLACFIFLRS